MTLVVDANRNVDTENMILPPMSESIPKYILAVFENWASLDVAVTEFIGDAIILLSVADREFVPAFRQLVSSESTEMEIREYALSCLEVILGRNDPEFVSARLELLPKLTLGSRILDRLSDLSEKVSNKLK